jgi:hypothetical protein
MITASIPGGNGAPVLMR